MDYYYKLLHRNYIPIAINSGNNSIFLFCKYCLQNGIEERFCSDHAILYCPVRLEFWKKNIGYILSISNNFSSSLSIATILSLGMYNLKNTETVFSTEVIKNIFGIGFTILITYPIDSNESIVSLCSKFNTEFKCFLEKLFSQMSQLHNNRISLFRQFANLKVLCDSTPNSLEMIEWKDIVFSNPLL